MVQRSMQRHLCAYQMPSPGLPVAQSSRICRKAFACSRPVLPGAQSCRGRLGCSAAARSPPADCPAADDRPNRRPDLVRQILRFSAGLVLLFGGAAGLSRPAFAANRLQQATDRLAAVASTSAPAEQEELYEDDFLPEAAASQAAQPQQNKQSRRKKAPAGTVRRKKGRRLDPGESRVPDPSKWLDSTNEKLGSFWRPDLMQKMTYTQMWQLVQEDRIDKVVYDLYERNCFVTTKASAPGGARTEQVTLPYDPALHAHLVEHGVEVRALNTGRQMEMVEGLARAATPFALAAFLISVLTLWPTFTAKLDQLHGGTIRRLRPDTTFADIAGLEEVKGEVMEVIEFLKNPKKFDRLGARSPLGVLLAGPPGTGKTLLARAIAGESKVPFFSVAGSEFEEVFVGVGAARVRGMFEKARSMAPCILFIDEFDGMAKKRSSANQSPLGQQDDSVQTINQLLTEMDGFENNKGVVFIAATNRPGVLDDAVVRPGRFDRIIHLSHPNLDARVEIMRIHMRDKQVDPSLDVRRLARACAGFTGAEIMGLMNRAAARAVRDKQKVISEDAIFKAIEVMTAGKASGLDEIETEASTVPPILRRTIAVYYAAKALVGELSPGFDELAKVAVCPGGQARGYTYCIPSEDRLEAGLLTRSFMETRLTVAMAGRCAERLVMGPGSVSSQGDADVREANHIAREMIFTCGFSRGLGPVALMEPARLSTPYSDDESAASTAQVGSAVARIALGEVDELVQAAEAKAYYGLTHNYSALQALVEALLDKGSLTGAEVREAMAAAGSQPFKKPYLEGFGWGRDHHLTYPGKDGANGNGAAHLPETALKSEADEDYSSADLDKRLHSEIPDAQRASLADILESRYLLGLEPSTFS